MYSNAMVTMAQLALSNVQEHTGTIENQDIIVFNNYIYSHIKTLDSKGKISMDLIVHLFKGCAQENDKDFVAYMKDREIEWQQGVVSITREEVMELAKEKYKLMTSKGTWQKMLETDKKIFLIQSQVDSMARNQHSTTSRSL